MKEYFNSKKSYCPQWDSNPQPPVLEADALPIDLPGFDGKLMEFLSISTKNIVAKVQKKRPGLTSRPEVKARQLIKGHDRFVI